MLFCAFKPVKEIEHLTMLVKSMLQDESFLLVSY